MTHVKMTRQIAFAASRDAANASARKANRDHWSLSDYNVAVRTFDRLWPDSDLDSDALLNAIVSAPPSL